MGRFHVIVFCVGLLSLFTCATARAEDATTKTASSKPAATKASTEASHPAEGAKEGAAGGKKVRVGFVVSLYTATGPSKLGRPYGYDHADIVEKLRSETAQL